MKPVPRHASQSRGTLTGGSLTAVVPAAGLSRRMGRAKLLLPLGDDVVIGRLLRALDHPAIRETIVVCRRADEALRDAAASRGARVVQPEIDPPDMRTSVEHGLRDVLARHVPCPADGWLLIPADHPVVDPELVAELVAVWQAARPPILIPTHAGRRGHPTFFRWDLADEVFRLPADAGINQVVRAHAADVVEHAVANPGVLIDLDTPEDYAKLCEEPPQR